MDKDPSMNTGPTNRLTRRRVSLARLRKMADAGFRWAEKHGLTRTNPIHGEEEARLVVSDEFAVDEEHGESTEQSGAFDLPETLLNLHACQHFSMCRILKVKRKLATEGRTRVSPSE